MSRVITMILMLLLSWTGATAQKIARVELKDFESKFFPFKRTVLIYTPEHYDESAESEYDVIYVFDAQDRSNFDEVHALLHYGLQQPNADRSYIVVGVASPYIEEYKYDRSNDFLPVPLYWKLDNPGIAGDTDRFRKFLKEELMQYINSNYRTSGHTLGVGHSLGATFVLDAMLCNDLFDDVIAISPNLGWDNDRFADAFINYDFSVSQPRYIFLTMGNEGLTPEDGWPEWWRPAWNKVKGFISNTAFPEKIIIKAVDLPEYSHNAVVLPAHLRTLKEYANYRHYAVPDDNGSYPIHIELSGSSVNGDVFITGNQTALADWNPQGVKMTVVNDTTRAIDLSLRLPAEFKFTKGDWNSAFYIINGDANNQRISSPHNTVRHYKTF